ncbi:MAG TPA: hypothetical protein VL461_00300 [Dictyobacter sp.]|jgi:hypothetical protein|nr:hypothetical protein [Dictyobacter sp.]
MHTSDQSSNEEQPEPNKETNEPISSSPTTQPEDEDRTQITPDEQSKHTGAAASIDYEAVRQGKIYPPPPDFYTQQNNTPPPADTVNNTTQPAWQQPTPQPNIGMGTPPQMPYSGERPQAQGQTPPWQQYPNSPYPPGQSHPGYPGYPGGYPPYMPVPPARRGLKKWHWILIATLSIIILASCGLCGWAGIGTFSQSYQTAMSIVYDGHNQVNNYYTQIQNQQYDRAYSYIQPTANNHNLTQTQFIKEAQQQDKLYGAVSNYTLGQPSIDYSNSNMTHFTIDVTVTRPKKTYTTTLSLDKIGNQWKVTNFTAI